jgi:hypothetical protein
VQRETKKTALPEEHMYINDFLRELILDDVDIQQTELTIRQMKSRFEELDLTKAPSKLKCMQRDIEEDQTVLKVYIKSNCRILTKQKAKTLLIDRIREVALRKRIVELNPAPIPRIC